MNFVNELVSGEIKKRAKSELEERLQKIAKNPMLLSNAEKEELESLYSLLVKVLGISEGAKWCVNWKVKKFFDGEDVENDMPYETCMATQNIVLDTGANEILKLIGGITGATAFSNTNAKIGVGSDTTPENASQTNLISTGSSVFYKGMESGYPQVTGRTIVFKSNFSNSEANFPWNEFVVVNGTGVGGIALNRKVESLGTKTTGIWSLEISISVTSNV